MDVDLPEECWEMILNLIEPHRYVTLSLVSKRFLSITNRLLSSLVVSDPSLPLLPRLLQRFRKLRSLDFAGFRGDTDAILSQIAKSGLDLETLVVSDRKDVPLNGLRAVSSQMRNLRRLNCSKICFLKDDDLGVIAECFPFLEELDISYPEHSYICASKDSPVPNRPISDSGIISLGKIKNLRKINLSGNHFVSDQSVDFLLTNCVLLCEVLIRDCDFITKNGLCWLISRCGHLNSFSFSGILLDYGNTSFKHTFQCTRSLSALDLSGSIISDEVLDAIAGASFPLNKLILSHCQTYTYRGISALLCKHQSLQYLDLESASFLTDKNMFELSKFLRKVAFLNLSLCYALTGSTFFNLARNCPLLDEFEMVGTYLGAEDLSTTSMPVNPRVKSLNLARNNSLRDDAIRVIASCFPNLQLLDLSYCNITEEGISEVLKKCLEIRCLKITHCVEIRTLLVDNELSNLEVLCARKSGIDDGGLAVIGSRCRRLLQLDLSGCFNVTAEGVMEVLQKCMLLREINLKWCYNVDYQAISLMVFSRPSLRKIVPPKGFVPSSAQRNFFLRHGCLVCDG